MTSRKSSRTEISAKPKQKATGRPFPKGHKWRWPKGVSGNPGGRPATLSGAYKAWLELPYAKDSSMTNAQAIAAAQGEWALYGDATAAREIRQATEGDLTNNTNTTTITVDSIVPLLEAARKLREGTKP